MTQTIGILTSGGDTPGLNAAIRGVGNCLSHYGMHIIGFRDGFRGFDTTSQSIEELAARLVKMI